ncbi:MAG: hypothetical protein ABI520_02410 [Caldimonas sp.]
MAAIIGAGVGALYGGAIAGPGARALLASLLISVPIGVIDALLMASWSAGIEIFLLPRASRSAVSSRPSAPTRGWGTIRWPIGRSGCGCAPQWSKSGL